MKNYFAIVIYTLSTWLIVVPPSQAADMQRGEQLHNSQCIACHASRFGNNGADIYTRADRRVQSLEGLKRQVDRCKNNLQIAWFDEDVADVVEYLNHQYYKFK